MGPGCGTGVVESGTACVYQCSLDLQIVHNTCMSAGAYEPPKAARSVQLRRTAFAFTRI